MYSTNIRQMDKKCYNIPLNVFIEIIIILTSGRDSRTRFERDNNTPTCADELFRTKSLSVLSQFLYCFVLHKTGFTIEYLMVN